MQNPRVSLLGALILSLIALQGSFVLAQANNMEQMDHGKPSAVLSNVLTITIEGRSAVLSLADLKAMPQKIVSVHNEHTKVDEVYSGVSLGTLLAKYGFAVGKNTHQKMLRSYIRAAGADNYWVLYSVTEVEPSEHAGDVIVAVAMNGNRLGTDGNFKLISTEDRKPQRWVRNLAAITLEGVE